MPHLWREDRSAETGEPEWVVQPLDDEAAVALGPTAGVLSAGSACGPTRTPQACGGREPSADGPLPARTPEASACGPKPSAEGSGGRVGSLRNSSFDRMPDGEAVALLLRSRTDQGETWLVMNATLASAAGGVALNGVPLHAGIRVLADRDEIRIEGLGRVFFSTEELACVASFPGADTPTFCPRCKQEVTAGSPAVRCPACQRWYHQSDEYPCWTYTAQCLCGHPTAMDTSYWWTPNGL
jgi:hypothetical protein